MDNSPLKTPYQKFIYYRTYSRWLESENRREFWDETVDRYFKFFLSRIPDGRKEEFLSIKDYTFNLLVMPAMRAVWSAGKALDRENITGYNCSYLTIDRLKAFAEMMYILLNGTGVGFSVEKRYIDCLPEIPKEIKDSKEIIVFADSKLGWAEGFYKYLKSIFSGDLVSYDLSKIRPEGARLKTSGGTASGPAPLKQLLGYTKKLVLDNKGKKLNSLQCYDLCCYIANIVVSGGVRRSACISLSDLSDDRMRNAKSGEFWKDHPQRRLSNNSAVYEEKPSVVTFLQEWLSIIKSKVGERGIFNRESCKFITAQTGRRDNSYEFGGNPCFTKDMQLLTENGYKRFDELSKLESVNLINEKGEISKGRVWSNGIKPVYEIVFAGKKESIKCTENHEFKLNDGSSCLAKDLSGKRLMLFNTSEVEESPYVRTVKYLGEEEVFDFSEPKTHWGVVNGVIVHNCLEIILRPNSFCNLTEVVIRPEDTKEELCKKVRYATILGCVQATLTKFNFLGRAWKKNVEEERLIGVSLTGLMDHPILNNVNRKSKVLLSEMKQVAIDTAEEWSQILGMNMPAAITCVKPSGTVSQLVDCASGLHTRYAPYYIRRVRVNKMDAVCKYLKDKEVNCNPEVGQLAESTNTFVFDFYIKSPETSVIRDEIGAIKQLEYWLMLQKYWCEHKPSITVYVKDEEWLEVGNWVYKNWDYVSGVSFLPYNSGVYQLPPYEEVEEEEYDNLSNSFPELDFKDLYNYEKEDTTEGAKEYACSAGGCEI